MDIRFGDYLLRGHLRQLDGPDGAVELGERSCDILEALLSKAGEVVSKTELMDTVWSGVAVEDNTLQVHVSALRKVLGPALIQTVHGRGYKYIGPQPNAADATVPPDLANAPDRATTSVAVLPFTNAEEGREGRLLSEGLAEDLITELARYRHLSVVGHRVSSYHGGEGATRDEAMHALGVDFIICGSVRTSGDVIRVSVQLIDAETGTVAWGDRFKSAVGDLFSVQDQIVGAVVARLAFNLDEAAARQRRRDPTSSGSAYVQFLGARTHWRNGAPRRALECALKAVALDAGYARARAYAAYFYAFGVFGQWFGIGESDLLANARHEIGLALSADSTDPFILQRASMTYLMLGDPQAALRYAEAAALESAHDSEILVIHGLSLACFGEKRDGLRMLERAIELEPRLSPGCHSALAEVRHMLHDYYGSQEALDAIATPFAYVDVLKAANLARLGDFEGARRVIADLPPGYDPGLCARSEANLCARSEDIAHWLESFRLAGLRV